MTMSGMKRMWLGIVAVAAALPVTADAHFTLMDFKRIVSAAAIDGDALAAEQTGRNPLPKASAPKL